MISIETFTKAALALPETSEQPHFEKISFRVNKKIFATLDVLKKEACIKLSLTDQSVFTAYNKEIIFAVPNKWGLQGWTIINLKKVPKAMCMDALKTAYRFTAPKKLASLLPEA